MSEGSRRKAGKSILGGDSEQSGQHGRFLCPREGVERAWRVVSTHGTKFVLDGFVQRDTLSSASALVYDGCSHRFDLEAGRPMGEAERIELYRAGWAMTLAGLAREHVDDRPARAAEIARASAAAGLVELPTFDAAGFEALARRLDAHLLPDQRDELITAACDIGRLGRANPYASPVLQTVGGALGYSSDELTSRLTS